MATEYDKKLIRQGNNSSRVIHNYMDYELRKLREETELYTKVKIRKFGANHDKTFTGYVIYKNSHMFTLEGAHYNESFTWFDLLVSRKYQERKEGGK